MVCVCVCVYVIKFGRYSSTPQWGAGRDLMCLASLVVYALACKPVIDV